MRGPEVVCVLIRGDISNGGKRNHQTKGCLCLQEELGSIDQNQSDSYTFQDEMNHQISEGGPLLWFKL